MGAYDRAGSSRSFDGAVHPVGHASSFRACL